MSEFPTPLQEDIPLEVDTNQREHMIETEERINLDNPRTNKKHKALTELLEEVER